MMSLIPVSSREICVAVTLTLALVTVASAQQQNQTPKGFQQVIPRGRIAAVDKPRYVPASAARIRPDAWVLGVVIEGNARAYSLDLLDAHEVVNDSIGRTNFAAVW